jgi:hypothetical protein
VASGARCGRCDAPLPAGFEATAADAVEGAVPDRASDGPQAADTVTDAVVDDAAFPLIPGLVPEAVEETRHDQPPSGPPVRERLPWPQPPFGPPARAHRPRPRVSGYVGWVLAGWTVVMAAGAVFVLWPGRGEPPVPGSVSSPQGTTAPQSASEGAATVPPTQRRYWVDTFGDAEGFREPGGQGEAAGVLRKGTHYVFCKVWGRRVERGDAYNHWWLLTDLDEVYAGGGPRAYVPALYLTHWGDDEAKDNDGVEIPTCPS